MKKILVLPLMFVFLCGCSKKSTVAPIVNDISFEAEIEYDESQFICDVIIEENVFDITVTEPQNISGLRFVLSGDEVTVDFEGILYSKAIDDLSDNSVSKILFKVFSDINNGKFAEYDGENCKISGKTDDYEYDFTFSPSGLPIDLEIDDLDLIIDFKNVTLK